MSAPSPVVATGFVIFRRLQREIQFLLLLASNEANLWTPPKGHVDHGESEREAAWRETEEEAGLSKDQLREVDGFEKVLSYTAWGKPKRVVYWMAELKNPETPVKISHEHAEYRWMDLKSAVEVSKYETQRELLSDAQKYLDANS